jgi:hypothetical protein
VPRFYFDVREGDSFTRDDDGLAFDSLDEAAAEAANSAAEIGCRRAMPLPNANPASFCIIPNSQNSLYGTGQRLLTPASL